MVQKIEYGDRGDTVSCYLPEGSVPDKSADVMILGLGDKTLAKILGTNYKFHYGKEDGCW